MTDLPHPLPDRLEIQPLSKSPVATIRVPGSKSITNRALILAALYSADMDCQIRGILRSEDTEVMIDSLEKLGFHVWSDEEKLGGALHVNSMYGLTPIPATEAELYVANSGTSMRFLTALVTLGEGHFRLDGSSRMRDRPIEDLLTALRELGANACSEKANGCPPVIVEANGLRGGRVRVRGSISSQFLSALLMIAPFAREEVLIEVDGPLVSWPYVSMTVEMLQRLEIPISFGQGNTYHVGKRPLAEVGGFNIEPDASAASYFFGGASITGGSVQVPELSTNSIQGDIRFVSLLEDMGCKVVRGSNSVTVTGGVLQGLDADMNDISDCVMTLAAVACFADGPTTIRNVAHIRHKETDRLKALATELRKVGVEVDEFADGLKITPRPLHGAEIETYNDHRMAMSMALIGLKVPGIVIRNPGCVTKTYPRFFEDLELLRQ
jgi:3-phosphoshikimate 1-carboxyvinyltransferase